MIVMKYSYQITVSEMSYFLTFLMQDETQDLESPKLIQVRLLAIEGLITCSWNDPIYNNIYSVKYYHDQEIRINSQSLFTQ